MGARRVILGLACVFLFVMVASAEDITCYSCANCDDVSDSTDTCTGEQCVKTDTAGVIARFCVPAKVLDDDCSGIDGAEACYCSGNKCNSAAGIVASFTVIFAGLIAARFM